MPMGSMNCLIRYKTFMDEWILANLHFVKDVDVFTTESFIQYINGAFDAWHNPWSKNVVSFDNFCNYILALQKF